ncbi:hypothetical protein D3C73_503960 [compost metagenome]
MPDSLHGLARIGTKSCPKIRPLNMPEQLYIASEAMQKYHCNVLLKNILYIISQTRSGIPVYSFLSLLTLHVRGELAC